MREHKEQQEIMGTVQFSEAERPAAAAVDEAQATSRVEIPITRLSLWYTMNVQLILSSKIDHRNRTSGRSTGVQVS